ncbi:hypothetical protein SAMN04489806_2098 [Paramicrobacterium humi]|uniref:Uridine kinase n=1 Tax=Paramicrobacterium humi TaxID=640635 RepID=A0A1H4N692_9MICO|nr:hypothetical protein [Microbacterium humi]SEB90836.1 hypothetical protein SAMN04489806_2098 [Microbacterium humi]
MAETTGARAEFLAWTAEQFLHNSRSGRRLIAVESAGAPAASRFADDLAGALAERGQHPLRLSLGSVGEATLRRDTIEPFRAGTLDGADDPDTVLIVDGQRLLNEKVRGIWHYTVWLLAGEELPHAGANLIVDASDESGLTDYYYDLCKLPPSFGERA